MAFMDGAEPVTLYISPDSGAAAFSWRPDSAAASHFLAMPEAGRAEAMRTSLSTTGGDIKTLLRSQFEKTGGLWTSVERVGEQVRILTRYWKSAQYAPPSRILVLNAGEPMELRSLTGNESTLELGPAQCALVPVDLRSEEQLQRWLEGLRGLPADLQMVTLQRALNGAILGASEHALKPAGAQSKLLAIGAAVAGLIIGAASGFVVASRLPLPQSKASNAMHQPLALLGAAASASSDPQVQFLSGFHLDPVALEPAGSQARRTAETWLALKLVLYRRQKPANFEAARASNEIALKQYKELEPTLKPELRQAVMASACSIPVTAIANAAQCEQLNIPQAQAGLAELAKPAEGAKKK